MKENDREAMLRAIGGIDDDLILSAAPGEPKPRPARRVRFVRRTAAVLAATLLLSLAGVGTAMAVSEDVRESVAETARAVRDAVLRVFGHGDPAPTTAADAQLRRDRIARSDGVEHARLTELRNEAQLWLREELSLDSGIDFASEDWSDADGVYVCLIERRREPSAGETAAEGYDFPVLAVVEWTESGFVLRGHTGFSEAPDDVAVAETEDVTAVFGSTAPLGERFAELASVSARCSDGSVNICRTFGDGYFFLAVWHAEPGATLERIYASGALKEPAAVPRQYDRALGRSLDETQVTDVTLCRTPGSDTWQNYCAIVDGREMFFEPFIEPKP